VTATTTEHTYTIKEAALLTGLPASTLRYYESMGVFAAVERGDTSGHRVYNEADMHVLMSVSCLNAIGMSVNDIRKYVENGALGPEAAPEQLVMLREQKARLAREAKQIAVRRRYVDIKLEYWTAVEAGDEVRAVELSAEARALATELKTGKSKA
jgi:DNA-binding transcriptional MerR regulator